MCSLNLSFYYWAPQVHDELVYEVKREHVVAVAEAVSDCMEGAWPMRVPFPVEVSVGPSWGELEAVSLEQLRATHPAITVGGDKATAGGIYKIEGRPPINNCGA